MVTLRILVPSSRVRIPASQLKNNTGNMNMALSIIIIAAFAGIILLAIIEPLYTYKQMSSYAQDIDKTVFYFKKNPIITCIIREVKREGYANPNVTLEVTYPDKSVGELITPLSEFQTLWMKED